jgi:hypothetical protein
MVSYKEPFQGLFHPSLTKKFANNFDVPDGDSYGGLGYFT